MRNVGKIDRSLRFLLGVFLVWLGLWGLEGLTGNLLGILMALAALLPFYMTFTASCFVFRWFKIHSLSKSESARYGSPYRKEDNAIDSNP